MDPFDLDLVPPPFPQNNTGVICYLNALLAMLVSFSSFTRAVIENAEYLEKTATGVAMLSFVRAYAYLDVEGKVHAYVSPEGDIQSHSAKILSALLRDLAVRRPNSQVRYGRGQECASETLVALLDMMEPPRGGAGEAARAVGENTSVFIESVQSPITRLFLHRTRCDMYCRKCKKAASKMSDHAVYFYLAHIDAMGEPPSTAAGFVKAMCSQASVVEDYTCPLCGEKTSAVRSEILTMIPEIIICGFNLYDSYGGARRRRYFPARLDIPAPSGANGYRLVAQIEQVGSQFAGHYWARALRDDGRVYLLNDTGISPGAFVATPNTYMIGYHYAGHTPAK